MGEQLRRMSVFDRLTIIGVQECHVEGREMEHYKISAFLGARHLVSTTAAASPATSWEPTPVWVRSTHRSTASTVNGSGENNGRGAFDDSCSGRRAVPALQ